ncbi:MAG: hypothetical protein IPL99_26235 [Candidatus Competibacteraceae bacterium]|nr:hypothetical protein [Candidatus Competibacteraceae bacterium]
MNRHPQMRTRVESLLVMVKMPEGDCERADAAERRVIGRTAPDVSNEARTALGGTRSEKQV